MEMKEAKEKLKTGEVTLLSQQSGMSEIWKYFKLVGDDNIHRPRASN